jgi:rubrerythrin
MKTWSSAIPHSKLRRPNGQSIAWYCKSCEKSTVAQMPDDISQSIRCPACGVPKETRN